MEQVHCGICELGQLIHIEAAQAVEIVSSEKQRPVYPTP